MKDFLFIYRAEPNNGPAASPEEMQASMSKWMDWLGNIAAQNKLADRGNRLHPAGKVVKPNSMVTDGPYTEIKESVGGYSLIKAESIEEAAEIAKGCPILAIGGNVEVRELNLM